jgi:hypothetical protein
MTRTMRIIFAALACITLAAPAAAQEGTLKKIKDGGSITIGHRDASIPFSYYDDKQQPVGYALDLCLRIVDAVKSELKMPRIDVKYQLVTSANRIPLMANGTIDLECGSTTNNLERQKLVGFTITHFVTANRWVARKAANLRTLQDLKGKTVVSTAGTTNIKGITEINAAQNLGLNIISANGHPEAFQMVETGRLRDGRHPALQPGRAIAQPRRLRDLRRSDLGGALRHHAAQGRCGVQEGGRRRNGQPLQVGADQRDLRQMVPETHPAQGTEPEHPDGRSVQEGGRQSDGFRRPRRIQIV